MKVFIEYNVLKHKSCYSMETWENVWSVSIEHQVKNGNWIVLAFRPGTEEYKTWEKQKGILYLNYDITADAIQIIQ